MTQPTPAPTARNKPIVDPGSMFNSSEGLLSTASLASLTAGLTGSADWRVQTACAIGIAIVAAAYAGSRTKVKAAATAARGQQAQSAPGMVTR